MGWDENKIRVRISQGNVRGACVVRACIACTGNTELCDVRERNRGEVIVCLCVMAGFARWEVAIGSFEREKPGNAVVNRWSRVWKG